MDELAEWVRAAFGLGDGPITLDVGGRGADGDVWHLTVGGEEFAVKRPFRRLDPEAVHREAALLDHLAAGGVEVPTLVATADGRLVLEVPGGLGGGTVRVSHWLRGVPAVDRSSEVATQLGTLLAQLHRAAPAAADPPRGWYTAMVPPEEWAGLVRRSTGQPWHPALAAREGDLTAYDELVKRAEPGTGPFVLGHRDLHPDNVLVAPDGSLRALDWEDAGSLDPTRELAKTLVQWHVLGDRVDEPAVARTVAAYRDAEGPGALTDLTDFAMLLCSETNFLAHQVRICLDDGAPAERRQQAHGEVTEALADYLPTTGALERVLAIAST